MIRDIMSKCVVKLQPHTTLRQTVTTLAELGVSDAPVVTDRGDIVGVISQLALVDMLFDHTLWELPVSTYMCAEVHTVSPDDSLSRAAHLFVLHGVCWLPVVDGGRVVGTVSCSDLLRHTMDCPEPLTEPLVELMPPLGRMT